MENPQWIQVRRSNIQMYKDVALYYQTPKGNYLLYKPEGEILSDERIHSRRLPPLFIRGEDKERAIVELQQVYNKKLEESIAQGDMAQVKDNLVNIVEETLSEPRSGTLSGLGQTVDIFIDGYSKESNIVKTLASISFSDYTTALHSVNVMALVLSFCFFLGFDENTIRIYGLSALFHDLGKTRVPNSILNAKRRLTSDEFEVMRAHPQGGFEILEREGFLESTLLNGALEHHEKLDGTGYPNRITDISMEGRIIGIIDFYEAVTNNDRPYRSAMPPLEALKLIKKEVDAGKFDRELFSKFAYSLT